MYVDMKQYDILLAMNESECQTSFLDLSVNELVELFPGDGLSTIAAHRVDNLEELLVGVAVFELVRNVSEVFDVEFSLGLDVKEGEVGSSAFFGEGSSLHKRSLTTLEEISLRNSSKLRADPPALWLMSSSNLKTSSYLVSRPRVWAVRRSSLLSALLCLGSA